MGAMKELDILASKLANEMSYEIDKKADWLCGDVKLDGDDYQEMKEYVINLAINKLLQK
tara:strand:- start:1060 stop:1236 length:177 start_codon:yes stop_codon:yes gene_type:complete